MELNIETRNMNVPFVPGADVNDQALAAIALRNCRSSATPFYVLTALIRLYLWVKASLPPSITRHISSRMEGS